MIVWILKMSKLNFFANGIRVEKHEHYFYKLWHKTRQIMQKAPQEAITLNHEDGTYTTFTPERIRSIYDRRLIARWHYFYSKGDKKISLVKTERGFYDKMLWEVCSGGTCEDCSDAEELFRTKKEAEKRIFELLTC